MHFKVSGYASVHFTHFYKMVDFCDFHFALLEDKAFLNGVSLLRKTLLLGDIILLFKS